ncbi:hypothetical protein F5972_32485 [Microbispora cellulosiformans]|uniref:RlpA-like protein double-psi beta-barrel domain-containing protein n=1 Tax=Microbispora cellulosiformans TaxID=2614688 RepID=A0A5J5JWK2_9ACTN|nr:hypothetical protein [Microbispora cellulosiformans]KAA9374284.1 hypothetical protein F5972_32485 [Microbispora cellulosiformans]
MDNRARQAVTAALAGTTLLLGTVTAAEAAVTPQAPPAASLSPADGPALDPVAIGAALNAALRAAAADAKRIAALPSGKATATSFWDAATASGKPMRYATLASPYWPLGTRVKITYKGKSAVGVVEDFGPAEWAVAQHDIPAIVDLSEKMMADLTGVASNTVHVRFQVLKWGKGRVYRHSGTGYDLAMGRP